MKYFQSCHFIWLLFTIAIAVAVSSAPCLAETKTICVDFESDEGTIDIVLGCNRNPSRWLAGVGGVVDMTEKLHDVGIVSLRTHGIDEEHSHPTNLEGMFPDWRPEWWTGLNDPFLDSANNNFDNSLTPYGFTHSTDWKIQDIINNGFVPFFRIGYRPNDDNKWDLFLPLAYTYMPNPIPDTDAAREKVAIVCENALRHYNEAWDGGYTYGIEFWEVWNEPDLKGMWGEDMSDSAYWSAVGDGSLSLHFKKLYEAIATRFRGTRSSPIRPEIKIGACALALTGSPEDVRSEQMCEEFLEYCRAHDVPVDFYSWHQYGGGYESYGGNSWIYLKSAERIRQALQTYGFSDALSICNEWSSYCANFHPYHDTYLAAAFTACALMYMEYADLFMTNYFPMARSWGLFDEYGNYTKEAYAFKAFHLLQAETPQRLAVSEGLVMDVDAGTAENFGIMAGKSATGDTIQILIADEDQKYVNGSPDLTRPSYDSFSLTLADLPPDQVCTVIYTTIDTNGTWIESPPETYVSNPVDRTITLEKEWDPPAVWLIRVDLADRYTGVDFDWERER
jgi:hypothetical protein